MMLIRSFFFYFLIFFLKAYVVVTHLNCINKLMQFKWVPATYACIKKWSDKKYRLAFYCVLIGVCVVIRWNMVLG